MDIRDEIIECTRRELEFDEARKHYARMARREREKHKALLALLDKEEARRRATGRMHETNRGNAGILHGGVQEIKHGGAR